MTALPLPAGSPSWPIVFAPARPFRDAAIEQYSGKTPRLARRGVAETFRRRQRNADEKAQPVVRFGFPVAGWGELRLASVSGSNIGVSSLGEAAAHPRRAKSVARQYL